MHPEKLFVPSEYIPRLCLNKAEVQYIHVFWNAVEPNPGEFKSDLLSDYAERCRQLRQEGKTVCVTLFNNNDPAWFTKEGGFTSLSGTTVYQGYLKKVVSLLSQYVDLWQPFKELPVLYDNSIGIIKETRARILQGNLAVCQLTAYSEIHRQSGYTYTDTDGTIKHVAVLLPEGCSMDGWLENASNAKRKFFQSSESTLLDDSSIVSIESSSV